MGGLDGVTAEDVRTALAAVDDPKAALRASVALAYLNGVPPTELAGWYGVSRSTIYAWLARVERLAEEPPEVALEDDERPGRPPKLPPGDRERLAATLREPPTAAGYDADGWTPGIVREHVLATYGVEYSRRHVRDLLHDLGFSPGPDGGWRPHP